MRHGARLYSTLIAEMSTLLVAVEPALGRPPPRVLRAEPWHSGPPATTRRLMQQWVDPPPPARTARSKPRYSKSRIPGEIACGSLQVALQSGLNGPVRTDFITQKHAECRYGRAFRRGYGGPGIDEVL